MSQGFPPQSGPQRPPGMDYASFQRDPMAPARRASILLFIVGGLIALLGIGNAALVVSFSSKELMERNQEFMPTTQQAGAMQLTPSAFKGMMAFVAGVEIVVGLGLMLLGTPVRRGRRWALITSTVTVGLIGAFVALMLLGSLLAGTVAPPMLAISCMMLVPTGLAALLLIWLIQALRALRPAPTYPGYGGVAMPTPPAGVPESPAFPARPSPPPYLPPVPPSGQPSVRYGYAQAPAPIVPQPPPGDAPVGGTLHNVTGGPPSDPPK